MIYQKYVKCDLSEQKSEEGLESWQSSLYPEYIEREGTKCRRLIVNQPDKRIYFRVTDDISGSCTAIMKISYFDEGTGHFAVLYRSGNEERWSEPVLLADTCEWKECVLCLKDIQIDRGICSNDLCIDLNPKPYGCSADHVIFSCVGITFIKTASISIEISANAAAGNTFYDDEDICLKAKFMSDKETDGKEALIIFTACGDDGTELWQETRNTAVHSSVPVEFEIRPNTEKYGLYILRAECFCDDGYNECHVRYAHSVKGERNKKLGGCVHFTERDSAAVAPLMSACGFGYIRDEFLWKDYEKKENEFNFLPEWERYLSDAEKNGLEMLTILGFNNPVYHNGPNCVPKTPEEFEAFERYVSTLVSYLGKRCSMYEIWNEPNLASFSKDISPEAYLPVAKAAFNAIKKSAPDAYIIGPGTSGEALPWIERFLELGGGDYIDAVSFHPYIWNAGPVEGGFYKKLDRVDKLIERYCPGLDMVVSEMGWGVQSGGVTRKSHAEYLVKTIAMSQSFKRLRKYFMYEFQDSGISVSDVERNFGLVEYWGGPYAYAAKPAYTAAAAFCRLVGSAEAEWFIGAEDPDGITAGCYKNSRGWTVMIWSECRKYDVHLTDEYIGAQIYDLNGNRINGTDFCLAETPIYIRTSFCPNIRIIDCAVERRCDNR